MDDQMIESLLRDFLDNGYYIVPGLLSSNEVSELRSVCESHSRIRKEAEMRASHFLSTPQLASVPFREEAIRVLEQLLGEEYTIFPNFTVRSEAYVPWHVDEGFIGKGEYLDNKDFLAVQCAVYLQDNVPKQGGAIDVIPGSHLDREVQPPETDAIGNCGGGPLALSLPVKAGDMVMWDGRIMHRSTPMGASSGQKEVRNLLERVTHIRRTYKHLSPAPFFKGFRPSWRQDGDIEEIRRNQDYTIPRKLPR